MKAPKPFLNPVQISDLRRILPLVPNERRLPVIAAYIGMSTVDLCRAAGLHNRARYYHTTPKKHQEAPGAAAVGWCWRIAKRLGLDFSELWEIDDGFNPARVLGLDNGKGSAS